LLKSVTKGLKSVFEIPMTSSSLRSTVNAPKTVNKTSKCTSKRWWRHQNFTEKSKYLMNISSLFKTFQPFFILFNPFQPEMTLFDLFRPQITVFFCTKKKNSNLYVTESPRGVQGVAQKSLGLPKWPPKSPGAISWVHKSHVAHPKWVTWL